MHDATNTAACATVDYLPPAAAIAERLAHGMLPPLREGCPYAHIERVLRDRGILAALAQVQCDVRSWTRLLLEADDQEAPVTFQLQSGAWGATHRRLAAGGCGTVWSGVVDGVWGAIVLKRPHDPHDARSAQEARMHAQLQHPGIPRWVGSTTRGELAIERIHGQTLRALVRGSPRPLPTAFIEGCAGQLADTLAAVHAAGVVHGDMKPENMLVGDGTMGAQGRAWLVDFGMARASAESNVLTRMDVTMGTPGYIAPQDVGRAAYRDERSDLFGLAASLHEAYVRQPLLDRDEWMQLARLSHDQRTAACRGVIATRTACYGTLQQRSPALETLIERALDCATSPDGNGAVRAVLQHMRALGATRLHRALCPRLPASPAAAVEAVHRHYRSRIASLLAGAACMLVPCAVAGMILLRGTADETTPAPAPATAPAMTAMPVEPCIVMTDDALSVHDRHGRLLRKWLTKDTPRYRASGSKLEQEIMAIPCSLQDVHDALESWQSSITAGLPNRPYTAVVIHAGHRTLVKLPRACLLTDGTTSTCVRHEDVAADAAWREWLDAVVPAGCTVNSASVPIDDAQRSMLRSINTHIRTLRKGRAP